MGIYRPHEEFLRLQIESILQQDYANLILHAIVDGPDREAERQLAKIADPRLHAICGTPHLGTYLNFGRGLETALANSGSDETYFAFADQDDIWEPQKLSVLVKVIQTEGSVLAFSDARVVDAGGDEISPSLRHLEGRMKQADVNSVLVANPASGMSMMFTRQIAECVCPFPKEGDGMFLHDWWVSVVAASKGPVTFVDQPLVQYRHHAGNQMGARVASLQNAVKKSYFIAGYRQAFLRRAVLAACLIKVSGENLKRSSPLLRKLAERNVSTAVPLTRMGISALFGGYTDTYRGAFRSAAGATLSFRSRK